MKFKLTLVLASLLLLTFMGCTEDMISDENRSALVERPWKSKASGTFNMVMPSGCDGELLQIDIAGSGKATHLGNFDVNLTNCTNLSTVFMISGYLTAANGDEIYTYNVGQGMDDDGPYLLFMIDGGTGRFEDASGEIRLYEVIEFTSPTGGIFSNRGLGTITY